MAVSHVEDIITDMLFGRKPRHSNGIGIIVMLVLKKKYNKILHHIRYGLCPFCLRMSADTELLENHIMTRHRAELISLVESIKRDVMEIYEKINSGIGDNGNDNSKKSLGKGVRVISIKMPEELVEKIDMIAQREGMNRSMVVRKALALLINIYYGDMQCHR